MSKYGLKPKGDYDNQVSIPNESLANTSKYGLKPKGDYDYLFGVVDVDFHFLCPNTD